MSISGHPVIRRLQATTLHSLDGDPTVLARTPHHLGAWDVRMGAAR